MAANLGRKKNFFSGKFSLKHDVAPTGVLPTHQKPLETSLKKLIYFSIIINLITGVLILLVRNNLPPEVPLFYGLAEGESQLTSPIGLLLPSAFSLFIISAHATLSFFWKDDFLRQTLILAGFAVTIFSVIATVKTILLVGSF